MRDLERELRALRVEWPETPDLAAAVLPRLEPRRANRRRRGRWVAAAVALLLGGVAAVEPARSAVLELLGLKSVRIERREPTATPTATPAGSDLGLGEPVARSPYPAPAELGAPDAIFRDGDFVTRVYGDPPEILVSQAPATVAPYIQKSVGQGARLERLRIDGAPAYFISGAPHGVAIEPEGGDVRFDEQRLAGNTLLVEREGQLIRIEGELERARAVAIARSIPPR